MNKNEIIDKLKMLPRPLVGGLAYDHNDIFNFRDSCIDMMKDVMTIAKPKEILEIGTHAGGSACIMLCLSEANLTSIDIGGNHITWKHSFYDWNIPSTQGGLNLVCSVLENNFPNRFRFVLGDSSSEEVFNVIKDKNYDLIFIDGNHTVEGVSKDINTAFKLNIPYMLLDDYNLRDGDNDGRIVAARNCGLTLFKFYENIHNAGNVCCGLFKNPHYKE